MIDEHKERRTMCPGLPLNVVGFWATSHRGGLVLIGGGGANNTSAVVKEVDLGLKQHGLRACTQSQVAEC